MKSCCSSYVKYGLMHCSEGRKNWSVEKIWVDKDDPTNYLRREEIAEFYTEREAKEFQKQKKKEL